jgi:hypothetical protein
VSRRVSLPGADELFRPTKTLPDAPTTTDPAADPGPSRPQRVGKPAAADDDADAGDKAGPSGRVRHDEKITVYVTADELIDIEHTRLALRRDHGLAVDRGRLIREAVHLVLADATQNGSDSALVRRLTES